MAAYLIEEHSLKVLVKLNMEVAVMELTCSKLETVQDEKNFAKKVEGQMKQRITGNNRLVKKK